MLIVFTNNKAQTLQAGNVGIQIGESLSDYFSDDVKEKISTVLASDNIEMIEEYSLFGKKYHIDIVPLTGKFQGKGVIMTLKSPGINGNVLKKEKYPFPLNLNRSQGPIR